VGEISCFFHLNDFCVSTYGSKICIIILEYFYKLIREAHGEGKPTMKEVLAM
jgi:hypothetical protein